VDIIESYRNILIFRIGQLGDTIVCLPVFQAIRRQFPVAHIVMLVDDHPGVNFVTPADVLPEGIVDEYIGYQPGNNSQIVSLIKKLNEIRRHKFDALIYLAPRQRQTWQIRRDKIFFRLAGIRHYIGADKIESLPDISKSRRPLAVLEHELDHYMYRLEASGIEVPPLRKRHIDLCLTSEEIANARKSLSEKVGEDWESKVLLGVCPEAKWPSKIWAKNRYLKVLKKLNDSHGGFPIILGSSSESQLGDYLIDRLGTGINVDSTLKVRESAAVLKFCRLYLGNDTGAMHLAAAVDTPCVVVCSAQDWPGRWYPYGQIHQVIRKSVPCEGCLQAECPLDHQCMNSISVEEVFTACCDILDR